MNQPPLPPEPEYYSYPLVLYDSWPELNDLSCQNSDQQESEADDDELTCGSCCGGILLLIIIVWSVYSIDGVNS